MATKLTISQLGEQLELTVRQGSTLGPIQHKLSDQTGAPLDLTGVTVRAYVRSAIGATPIEAEFVIEMAADRTEGYYFFSIPDEVTSTLSGGATKADAESQHVWDSEMQLPDGRVVPLYYGALYVIGEVTRPD